MIQTSLLGLLGAVLLSCSCLGISREEDLLQRHPRRIISFHAPSPVDIGFDKQSVPVAPHPQYLIPVPSEPAPVHEEQNEPPPPPPRVRAQLDPTMVNPPGYAVDAANLYVAQGIVNQVSQPPAPAGPNAAVPGVVQLARPVVPNAPNSIVNPPPPEMLPTTNVQPISIDPSTGEPLKTVSPKFRALLRPDAPPVSVPSPVQASFGRGFGGAAILDVTGAGGQQQQQQQQQQQPQAQPAALAFSSFSQQPEFSNIQQSNDAFSNFQQSNSQPSSSSFDNLSNNGGDIISIQTFGATSSINSNSGSFGSTPISVGSGSQSLGESSASLDESLNLGSLGDSPSLVTTSQEGASHSVHISLPQSSYSSTVFHGN